MHVVRVNIHVDTSSLVQRLCAALHVQVCKQVPTGKVSTYGALAKVLGSSPRAVGQVQTLITIDQCCMMPYRRRVLSYTDEFAGSIPCIACTAQWPVICLSPAAEGWRCRTNRLQI